MRKPTTLVAASVLSLGLMVAGCSSDNKTDNADKGVTATTLADMTDDSVPKLMVVTDAWCRTSAKMASAGGCYMVITNNGSEEDELIGVSVDESVAAKAEVHETTGGDTSGGDTSGGDMSSGGMSSSDGDGSSMGDSGDSGSSMMGMQQVDSIRIEAGESVELKPGGYHIMLMELADELKEGATIELTLEFRDAGKVVVNAEVRSS